jgi:hypothetical protein
MTSHACAHWSMSTKFQLAQCCHLELAHDRFDSAGTICGFIRCACTGRSTAKEVCHAKSHRLINLRCGRAARDAAVRGRPGKTDWERAVLPQEFIGSDELRLPDHGPVRAIQTRLRPMPEQRAGGRNRGPREPTTGWPARPAASGRQPASGAAAAVTRCASITGVPRSRGPPVVFGLLTPRASRIQNHPACCRCRRAGARSSLRISRARPPVSSVPG